MRVVAGDEATLWLREAASRSGDDSFTGFDIDVWESSIWVLNAMYESEAPLPDVTADELRKQHLRAGDIKPFILNGVNLDERTVTTGQTLGRSNTRGVHLVS
jgi:hypothetical protein